MPNNNSKHKWFVMTLLGLTGCFVIAMPQMCMPVLFKEISVDLDLSLVEIGVVWGMLPLAGLLLMLVGGMLADRFGAKKMLVIGCILTGLAGAARGLATNFPSLAATMFLFGILQMITAPSMLKMLGTWFAGKRLGLANGVLSTSMGFGFLLSSMISASILSPFLGGWQWVMVLYGAVTIVVGILWYFSRSAPENADGQIEEPPRASFKESILAVIRIRNIWVLGMIVMLQIACVQGMLGYLPTYLKDAGWDPALADNSIALFHGMSTLFTIPVVLLSDRFKSRKLILFVTTVMTAVGVGILGFNAGVGVWIAMIVAGCVRDGFMATQSTMLLEMKGLSIAYLGIAIGFINTIGRIGEIISPPVGNSLAETNTQYPFLMWAGLAVLALLGFLFFKKEPKQQPEQPVEA